MYDISPNIAKFGEKVGCNVDWLGIEHTHKKLRLSSKNLMRQDTATPKPKLCLKLNFQMLHEKEEQILRRGQTMETGFLDDSLDIFSFRDSIKEEMEI